MSKQMVTFFVIFLFSAPMVVAGNPTCSSVDTMAMKNSSHLLGLKIIDKYKRDHDSPRIRSYFLNPYAASDAEKRTVLGLIVDDAPYFNGTCDFIIQDEVIFRLCICIMANYSKEYLGGCAFNTVCLMGRFDHLAKYSSEIKAALAGKKSIDNYPVVILLCLLNLDAEEKDSLLKSKDLPRWARARLGDTIAENSLINKYINDKMREGDIREFGLAGTSKCIRTLLKTFNDTIYRQDSPGNKKSMTCSIIPVFGRLNPDNELLTNGFVKIMRFLSLSTPKEQVDYLYKVIDWMKQTYGITPDIPKPLPFMLIESPVE